MRQNEYIYDEGGFIIVKDACINIDSIIGIDIKSNYGNDWYVCIHSNTPGFALCISGIQSYKKANETMSDLLSVIKTHKNPPSVKIEI